MGNGYFRRVAENDGTRLWINNPTGAELELAIAAGAYGCTSNPAYCAMLIEREPQFILPLIDQAIASKANDDEAAEQVYQQVVARARDQFLPLFRESGGKGGFAIIQGDPRKDWDVAHIVAEALRNRALGENVMIKLPANQAGAQALEQLVPLDVPTCVTEVLGIGQAMLIWRSYRKAAESSGHYPPLFTTHITGPLDRYLSAYVQREAISIAPEVLQQAGLAVAKEQYRIYRQGDYDGLMMIGGAIAPHYFTELVGGNLHITIDWVTAQQLLESDPAVVDRVSAHPSPAVLAELQQKLPDFARSYTADRLPPEEFDTYGPLAAFRGMFLERYGRFLEEIAARRANRT